MSFIKRRTPLLVLAAAVLAAGCVDEGDELITSGNVPTTGNELFARYVALGNSITAGFQSNGLTPATQRASYAVLLAERAGVSRFGIPLVNNPGCPVPFTAPLTPPPANSPACAGRDVAAGPSLIQNLAVPGARIRDLLVFPSGNVGNLNTVLVGARTQVQAMIAAEPTFVSAWIGNNDALEATLGGILGPRAAGADSSLTPLATFQASLNALVDSIKSAGPQGVMLVGVVDAVAAAPLIQPGAYFFLARAADGTFNGKPVHNNCSPVNDLGQPNPLSFNMVSFGILSQPAFLEINCDPDAYPVGDQRRGAFLLDLQEQAIVRARVGQYNAAIQAAAQANNWVYVNPNDVLAPYLLEQDAQGRFQRIRKCQALPAALQTGSTPAVQAAVVTSCPVPPTGPTQPFAAPNFFGSLISFDGVHPSTEAHRILAGAFAQRINQRYGTTLSTVTN